MNHFCSSVSKVGRSLLPRIVSRMHLSILEKMTAGREEMLLCNLILCSLQSMYTVVWHATRLRVKDTLVDAVENKAMGVDQFWNIHIGYPRRWITMVHTFSLNSQRRRRSRWSPYIFLFQTRIDLRSNNTKNNFVASRERTHG